MSFRFISATVTDRRLGAPTSALKALPGRLQNPSASFVLMRVRVEGTVVLTKRQDPLVTADMWVLSVRDRGYSTNCNWLHTDRTAIVRSGVQ